MLLKMQVILNDPFLGKRVEEGNFSTVPLRDEFLENARLFIFETYCRIHQRIDMGYVPSTSVIVAVRFHNFYTSLYFSPGETHFNLCAVDL
jgi:hypothetical protein